MNNHPLSNSNKNSMIKSKEESEAAKLEHQPLTKKKRKQGGSSMAATSEAEHHKINKGIERERRKRMRDMFSNLRVLLPQLPPKADKLSIVDEAVRYIPTVQHTLHTLQKLKLERLPNAAIVNYDPTVITTQHMQPSREKFLAEQCQSSKSYLRPKATSMPLALTSPFYPPSFKTWTSPNVVMSLCGFDAQISVSSMKKPGILSTLFQILEKNNLEVVSAHACADPYSSMHIIYVHAYGAFDQLPEALSLSVEEKFKLVIGEINLWLSSSY